MLRAHAVLTPFLVIAAAASMTAQSAPQALLKIVVVEGEGAINNIRDHTARAPVVRVVDDDNRPVEGATVTFQLPDLGASGYFPESRTHLTTTTDRDGRAVARGLRPNNVAGRFQIRVSAAFSGRTASATVTQVNVAPATARKNSHKKIIIAVLIAGGAAGAALAAKGGGGGSSSGTGTTTGSGNTLTPGSPVFGPPR